MISMTGYGRAESAADRLAIAVEISSVNKRNLDVSVSLPREWQELEPSLAERVRRAVRRGKVHVSVRAEEARRAGDPGWNEEGVAAALERLRNLAERHGVPFEPDTGLLYRMAVHVSESGALPGTAEVRDRVGDAVEEALRALVAMREKEGRALAEDLGRRVDHLRGRVAAIGQHAGAVTPRHREMLHQRLRQAGLELDPDDERVLREIALFADRCDISEELTRLGSHLEQLGALPGETGEPVGRKAEFLVQEIQREFNTIASKANDLEIARNVIECRNELEKVREQVQNVE